MFVKVSVCRVRMYEKLSEVLLKCSRTVTNISHLEV